VGIVGRCDDLKPVRKAAFLDRDGVINALVADPATGMHESPYRVEDVLVLPGAGESLSALAHAGWVVVVASNQPAAAKGIATIADLAAVHDRLLELLGRDAGAVTAWHYCHHHPDAADPALRDCECRKPKPGMLIDAARELDLDLGRSWMIGDADRDIAAGQSVGCATALIENPASAHRRTGSIAPSVRAADLPSATVAILGAAR
jgi:histidinol-phosphate phosphatase family protein